MDFRPLSNFATAGARAYGSLGIVPDSDDKFPGLQVAEYALLPSGETLIAPSFVHVEFSNPKDGKKHETAPMFVVAILYNPDKPDTVIVYGPWAVDTHDTREDGQQSNFNLWYDSEGILRDAENMANFSEMGADEYLLDFNWWGFSPIRLVDPVISVVRQDHPYPAILDKDQVKVTAFMRQVPYGKALKKRYLKIDALPDNYSAMELVDLMPSDVKPPWLVFYDGPKLLGGIEPRDPAFASVRKDAFFAGEHVYPVGGAPGLPMYSAEFVDAFDGLTKCGFITSWGRGAGAGLKWVWVREYVPLEHVARGAPLAPQAVAVPGRRDHALAAEERRVACTALVRPMVAIGQRLLHKVGIDLGTHAVEVNYYIDTDGRVKGLPQPTTLQARRALKEYVDMMQPYKVDMMQNVLRNEARFQCVPGPGVLLHKAKIVIAGMGMLDFLSIPGAIDAEEEGDRNLTVTKAMKTPADVMGLLGNRPLGHVVPEKRTGPGRRKRPRKERWCGFILINVGDEHENSFSYTEETKEFTCTLACSFFGTNLNYVSGVEPPPPPTSAGQDPLFDIVTRKWVPRLGAAGYTQGRALDYFGSA